MRDYKTDKTEKPKVQTVYAVGDDAMMDGQKVKVVDPNWGGKGTIEVAMENGESKVVHLWDLTPMTVRPTQPVPTIATVTTDAEREATIATNAGGDTHGSSGAH